MPRDVWWSAYSCFFLICSNRRAPLLLPRTRGGLEGGFNQCHLRILYHVPTRLSNSVQPVVVELMDSITAVVGVLLVVLLVLVLYLLLPWVRNPLLLTPFYLCCPLQWGPYSLPQQKTYHFLRMPTTVAFALRDLVHKNRGATYGQCCTYNISVQSVAALIVLRLWYQRHVPLVCI